jgi:hypothetical protein
LNGQLAVVQTTLSAVQGQANDHDTRLDAQRHSIDDISALLGALDVRVTDLESIHDNNAREFTITDNYGVSDFDLAGLRSLFSSLNMQLSDYLHVSGTGSASAQAICTNSPRARESIDEYIGGYNAGSSASSPGEDTLLKSGLLWSPSTGSTQFFGVGASTYIYFFALSNSNSVNAYIYANPTYSGGLDLIYVSAYTSPGQPHL